MIMNPTTTPGKAKGKVSMDTMKLFPGKLLRVRKTPENPEMIRVASVTAIERRTVFIRVAK
jgi:hypothetical protein